MSIAVIYGGTRPNGNSEILTEQVIQGIATEKIYLRDFNIQPIIDMRHSKEGFQERNDDYNSIIDRILPHDILIFSTPIYWYSMSGTMKNFIDRWSQTLRDPKYPDFKSKMASKKAFVIAVGGDDPYIKGLPLIQQFQYIFDFMGIEFAGYILGNGNKPGEVLQDKVALFAATQMRNKLTENI
ncbi:MULTISPECIES: flavodoxin family protein [Geobacillus]|jgi:multimeric flavodoxin WrbA|nr:MULTISPECIES: flavodoxin family protein [Geobacillus]ARA98186.1 NAD(P)H-dependent oxidoreductase [Geobacillus thermodenitrificans]ATO37545.1 NAD(P)H-dependent oxidoreductase [Geobacillus thermodenitrificans]KQB91457.1 putative NAD(P)H-dependent FMN-containing oxidoreductase YwqN [Geobacillus sp. PA-3]MEC5188225.1 multimeric flavodoxin WrbA [Geobacillus thermodenitrificans]MED3907043.1 flavodoxin family protein [Geobacillus thermodenitrificans]